MKVNPNPDKVPMDYYTAKSIRSAIASELARRIHITEELVAKKEAADKAASEFRDAVRQAIDEQRGGY